MKNYKNFAADAVANAGTNVQITGEIYSDPIKVDKNNLSELAARAAGGQLSEWSTQDLPEGTSAVRLMEIQARKSKAPKDATKDIYFVAKCEYIKGKHFVTILPANMVSNLLDSVGKSVKITKSPNGKTYTSSKGVEYPSFDYTFQGELAVKA